MKYNFFEIILGILVLLFASYILLIGLTYIYLRLVSKKKEKNFKWILFLIIAAVSWVAATLLSFMLVASFGLIVFGLVSFAFLFGILFLFNKRLLLLSGNHKIIYPLTLAVVLNPVWLFAFKLL